MAKVYDLNKFKKEPISIIIGDRTFNITKIPFDISLELYELIPVFQEMEKSKVIKKEDYLKILNIFYSIFKLSEIGRAHV
jgi:hypothetical protein